MRKIIYVSLTAVVMAAAPVRLDHTGEPEEISRLDDCIQRRFLGMNVFGMSRILPSRYHGVGTFRPENATEMAVVEQLKQKGYALALYLAGRGVLDGPANQTPGLSMLPDQRRSQIQGPAYITAGKASFPLADTLLADGRRALVSFQKGEGFNLQKGEWTLAMRPLRASSSACVQCHTAGGGRVGNQLGASRLKIGDPLGVAMYVYSRN